MSGRLLRYFSLTSILFLTGCPLGIRSIEASMGRIRIDFYEPSTDPDQTPEESESAGEIEIDTTNNTAVPRGIPLLSGDKDPVCRGEAMEDLINRLKRARPGDPVEVSYEKNDDGCVDLTLALGGASTLGTATADTFTLECCVEDESNR